MNELSKHIEALLLENDCVVVPGMGGFVAHHVPAQLNDEGSLFLPPSRVVGFNQQLTMNDGLLTQSYASAHSTSFATAALILRRDVDDLTRRLRREGRVELDNIGQLRCSVDDAFSFTPYNNLIATPSLYGLGSFEMPQLSSHMTPTEKKTIPIETADSKPQTADNDAHDDRSEETEKKIIRFNPWILPRIAVVVAAVVVFFALSTPVGSPDPSEADKAGLASIVELAEINNQPSDRAEAVETPVAQTQDPEPQEPRQEPQPAPSAPAKVSEQVAVAPGPQAAAPVTKEATPTTARKRYHIIVASVGTEADAQAMAKQLQSKGYAEASAVIGDGRNRVAIASYATEAEAHQSLSQIRAMPEYQSAWMLKK